MARKDRLDSDNKFLEGLIKLIIALIAATIGYNATHPSGAIFIIISIYCVLSCIVIMIHFLKLRKNNADEIEELD